MRTILIALAACAACATAPNASDPAMFASGVRAGQIDAATYDFAAQDFWTRDEEERRRWRQAVEALTLPSGAEAAGCGSEDLRGLDAAPWLLLAATADNETAWRSDRALLHANAAESEAQTAAHVDGVGEPNSAIGGFQRDRQATSDPRLRDLFGRAIRDQSAMFALIAINRGGLSPRDAALRMSVQTARLARMMCANTQWLRTQMADIGWFDIARHGERADNAAWLIAQHSDRTPGFQRNVLETLEALPAGATNPRNLAYLWDRLSVADGRSQRYGSQLACVDGRHVPRGGLEDEANVHRLRAQAGLQPLDEYAANMDQFSPCPR